MNAEERKEKTEALIRYESLRRDQLGTAGNLIFLIAAAGVGFCASRIADKDSQFSLPGTYYFLSAAVALVITVAIYMLTTFTRLADFRTTAHKIREELRGKPENELKKLSDKADTLGRRTWVLFRAQSVAFCAGILLLISSVWMLNRSHLFPKPERVTLLTGSTAEPYVFTGKYSVGKATHIQQMTDCKQRVARFIEEIHTNKLKPGENLLMDDYDAAFLGAHYCVGYAVEPLDQPAREVVGNATNLDSLIIARERVRYEDVKAQLDYYKKRFH